MTNELSGDAVKVEQLSAELQALDDRRARIGVELVDLQFGLDGQAKILATKVLNEEYFGRLFALADELRDVH